MDWTSADLAAFNIIVQDQDQDSFFDGPLPDYTGFPGFLETEDVIMPKGFALSLDTDVKHAREEVDAEPMSAEWPFNSFLASLLDFMKYGYQSRHPAHTMVCKGNPVRLIVRNETASTIANVEVRRATSYLTMLVLQHSKTIIKRSDPEAHLIASAIGAFQQNGMEEKPTEVELEQQVMLGITTAEQFIPTFYKIKVTAELDCAVRLGEKPAKQTIVYRHKARFPKPDEDIMTLENRRRLALYLEGFRKLLEVQYHGWPCPTYCVG
ncbi:hypothetical protein F5887DRAFT_289970 [Amanita rubescens]|nr:hypothetical protein F5887DRAFT_289970 [Amanita rubescens]